MILTGAARSALPPALGRSSPQALKDLSRRERPILDLLAAGLTTGAITQRLHLAPKTVRNRLSDMLPKLGVADRAQAIKLARNAGLGQRF